MELDFRHLRIVCAIADAGSVTRASTQLNLSQPALTHQLQRIENLLGGQLFTRDRHGAHPTALGQFVLSRGRALLSALDDLTNAPLREPPTRRSTTTRLHVSTTGSPASVPLLETLRTRLPEVTVTLRTDHRPGRTLTQLASHRLDLALVGEYPDLPLARPPGVVVATVTELPVFVMLSADHPLAGRTEIKLDELAGEKWILRPERQLRSAENLRMVCATAGFAPHVAHWLDDWACLDAVRGGHGITLARPGTADADNIAVRPLQGAPIVLRDLLAWPTDGTIAPLGPDLVTTAARATWRAMTRVASHATWLNSQNTVTGWV